ncbi:hypothetical protein CVT24_007946 [Panaeolus cyanescens]|uniref:Uncharacterized protein n=1 Tax=Panaeolus cyanescens TaxID=181874 RepID=A0A409YR11_9AGAR|nr:hypothetical protein CVT24_007946 [Panaeolus cyanescens]
MESTPLVVDNFVFANHLELSISRELTWPRDELLTASDSEPSCTRPASPSPSDEYLGLGSLTPLPSPLSSRPGSPTPNPTPSPSLDASFPTQQPGHVGVVDDPVPMLDIPRKLTRKERSKLQSKLKRQKERQARAEEEFSVPARKRPKEKYVDSATAISAEFLFEDSKHTLGAYTGMKTGYESNKVYQLHELVGPNSLGFKYIAWDGRYVYWPITIILYSCTVSRTPRCITDQTGTICGVLAGHPPTSDWTAISEKAAELMAEAQRKCLHSTRTAQESERGPFPSLRCGVSHGGGQTHPQKMANSSRNEALLRALNKAEPFRRITGFASSVFATWAPKLHQYYEGITEKLYTKYPDLPRPFERSVFCATTYNLGPFTVCFPHVDVANLSFGWCAICALGQFNPAKGGHLVLWDCKLVIEFPPGSLVLIPSATIAHSNIAIDVEAGEARYSFTQYTAGGLFRWVENGFVAQDTMKKSMDREGLKAWRKWMHDRWQFGLSLLPKHIPVPSPPSM